MIASGERVKWTAPGGGIREYEGGVLCFVPPGQSLFEKTKHPRYLIGRMESADGKAYRAALRLAHAAIVERQNPDARRVP